MTDLEVIQQAQSSIRGAMGVIDRLLGTDVAAKVTDPGNRQSVMMLPLELRRVATSMGILEKVIS